MGSQVEQERLRTPEKEAPLALETQAQAEVRIQVPWSQQTPFLLHILQATGIRRVEGVAPEHPCQL